VLELSDRPISQVIEVLASYGIEAGYLVPTETGLSKSILDAHGSLREYFKASSFHDYSLQSQGTDSKRVVQAYYVTPNGLQPTQVSMYRPETKTGDPRIWPYELKKFAKAGNLLALFADEGTLYIANASDLLTLSMDGVPGSVLGKLLKQLADKCNKVANELLDRIKTCTQGEWIQSLRDGPTGVGFTLETLLGIAANNSKAPDYKGIELKAGRQNFKSPRSRSTLFAKTPDWAHSVCQSGIQLLDSYGYVVDGRKQLYCSLRHTPNSLGHFLEVSNDELELNSMHQSGLKSSKNNVLHWNMSVLRTALAEKHKETFWVKAQVKKTQDGEQFRYTEITHTKGPLLSNMAELFRLGSIELDYCVHEKLTASGSRVARDHGYLFKIWPRNFNQLFPPPATYRLV
jgi:MvaI/BcnI restriction endonuclease family